MSRYIDADALTYYGNHIGDEYEDRFHDAQWVYRSQIDDAPSIDIVRCKECKFSARYVDDGHIECRLYSHPLRHDYHEMKADDFCSYGVKKGADDE